MTVVRYIKETDTLVYSKAEDEPHGKSLAIALGFFDGVHLGHAACLATAVRLAAERGLSPAVFTFDTLPLKGDDLLLSKEERLRAILSLGIDAVFLADFAALRTLSPEAFVRELLIGDCHAAACISGENFRFGKNAVGTPALLSRMIDTCVVPPVMDGDAPISATRIRRALRDGSPDTAARLLGRPYTLKGKVIHGKRLGRQLGFPTANMALSDRLSFLRNGVYLTHAATADGRDCYAITNIGIRPTVNDGCQKNAESHLLDFDGDLYGTPLTLSLLRFLRPEQQFSSLDALASQLKQDQKEAGLWITKITPSCGSKP